MQMIFNPYNGTEVWATDWINKRLMYTDEYAFWHGALGLNPITISAQWFNSIPNAY